MAIVIVKDGETLERLERDQLKFYVEVPTPDGPNFFQVGIQTAREMLKHARGKGWRLEADTVNYLAFLEIKQEDRPGQDGTQRAAE